MKSLDFYTHTRESTTKTHPARATRQEQKKQFTEQTHSCSTESRTQYSVGLCDCKVRPGPEKRLDAAAGGQHVKSEDAGAPRSSISTPERPDMRQSRW
jgi:hypothetical protein